MQEVNSYIGLKFNRLQVIKISHKNRYTFWLCLCECGKEKVINLKSVKSGKSKSCGCLQREKLKQTQKAKIKHGESHQSVEYRTWANIKTRCSNIGNDKYKYWAGKGITMCERWLNSYENFLNDMGRKPSLKHSIERIDNSLGYSPENCKWATSLEQCRNRTNNVSILNLETGIFYPTIVEAAEAHNLSRGEIRYKLTNNIQSNFTIL